VSARWVAENVALSPDEAAVELENEMRAAERGPAAAGTEQVQATLASEGAEHHGATFAAAAGAEGASTTTAVSAEEPESSVTPEAVAAWQNWQQIRETVMNARNTVAVAESAAQAAVAQEKPAEVAVTPPEESAGQTSNSGNSQSTDLEAGALASIVDTMLAELKPKLMEEIAKKLKK
jgi:hypothetical protein